MERLENRVIKYGVLLEELVAREDSFGSIAKILTNKIYKKIKIERAIEIANEANVSNATITKFVKAIGFNNFNELALIHNSSLVTKEKEAKVTNDDIIKAAELIDKARKILFIGVSNSYIINEDFGTKLQRMDKWVVMNPSKYEQAGLAKLLNEQDLLIVNSISLQHTWMSDLAKMTKAKVIVITAVDKKSLKFDSDIYFKIRTGERNDLFRIVTMENRNEVYKVFDQIMGALLKNDDNFKMLEASSYRNATK